MRYSEKEPGYVEAWRNWTSEANYRSSGHWERKIGVSSDMSGGATLCRRQALRELAPIGLSFGVAVIHLRWRAKNNADCRTTIFCDSSCEGDFAPPLPQLFPGPVRMPGQVLVCRPAGS